MTRKWKTWSNTWITIYSLFTYVQVFLCGQKFCDVWFKKTSMYDSLKEAREASHNVYLQRIRLSSSVSISKQNIYFSFSTLFVWCVSVCCRWGLNSVLSLLSHETWSNFYRAEGVKEEKTLFESIQLNLWSLAKRLNVSAINFH